MVKLNTKISATTLIEVLMSLSIITISVGIAMMIHTNIIYSNRNSLKMKANLLINEISIESKKNKDFADNEAYSDNLIVYKKVESYKNIEFLYQMSFVVRDVEGRKLADRKELVLIYDKMN